MDVSVVIITKNQRELLEKTIPILKHQAYPAEFEIIVVDSGSTDGAKEYCKSQKVKLVNIPSKNFNYAAAFNKGARMAKGRYLVRLSGDCIPQERNFLLELTKPFNDPKVGGTFGRYVVSGRNGYTYPDYWPPSRFPKKLTRYSIKPFLFLGAGFLNFSLGKNVYEFAGGCCAVRRSIWEKRPFNEKLSVGEDAEYAWFLHIIGYDIVYNPNATVLHEHRKDLVKTLRTYLGLYRWNWTFNQIILVYWLKRIFLAQDPYKKLYLPQ